MAGERPERDVLELAALIRKVDGNHDLGASALAEALISAEALDVERLTSVLRREWDSSVEQFFWASDPGRNEGNAWADKAAAAIVAALATLSKSAPDRTPANGVQPDGHTIVHVSACEACFGPGGYRPPETLPDDLTEPVPAAGPGVTRREPAGRELSGQGVVTGSVSPAPLCGFVMATCRNEPDHPGDHWHPAAPSELPREALDVERLKAAMVAMGGWRGRWGNRAVQEEAEKLAREYAALPDRPTPP